MSHAQQKFAALAVLVLVFALFQCGDSSQKNLNVNLQGAVQKGPFVVGSSVDVIILDGTLDPTGQIYSTFTNSDLGEFELSFTVSGAVGLEGTGYYYNELQGSLSNSQLTLRALYEPASAGSQQAYINIVTHLTSERLKRLVQAGTAFSDAVTQAENELRQELGITPPSFSPNVNGIDMNLAGGDDDNNAYLLGVSSVLTGVAQARVGAMDANLQELLNAMTFDLADGSVTPSVKTEIGDALRVLDVDYVTKRLAQRLSDIGSTATVPDMHRVLDQDRDGLANAQDNCPNATNESQDDLDSDDIGDVCDECPDLSCAHACMPANTVPYRPADVCYDRCVTYDNETTAPIIRACDAGSCFEKSVITNVTSNSQSTSWMSSCAVACDPAQSSCPVGTSCQAARQAVDATLFEWVCLPHFFHDGDALAGDYCEVPAQEELASCAPGLFCADPEFRDSSADSGPFRSSACRQICNSSTDCEGRPCITIPPFHETFFGFRNAEFPTIKVCQLYSDLPLGELGDYCGINADASDTCNVGLSCTSASLGHCIDPNAASDAFCCKSLSGTIPLNGVCDLADTQFVCDASLGLLCQSNVCLHSQCSDGISNGDDDTLIDFADPGCENIVDDAEGSNPTPTPQCFDTIDNDGNGLIDYPADPGCSLASDNVELTCTDADPVVDVLTSPITGNTSSATNDFVPSCSFSSTGNDIVHVLSFPGMLQNLTLDTENSVLDTVLSIRQGDCSPQNEIACDDDGGVSALSSLITLTNIAAGTYIIVVSGTGSGGNTYNLNVSGVIASGEACDTAQVSSGLFTCAGGGICTSGICQ